MRANHKKLNRKGSNNEPDILYRGFSSRFGSMSLLRKVVVKSAMNSMMLRANKMVKALLLSLAFFIATNMSFLNSILYCVVS